MMGGMLSDDNHYRMLTPSGRGIGGTYVPPMLFVDGPRGASLWNWKINLFPRYRWCEA